MAHLEERCAARAGERSSMDLEASCAVTSGLPWDLCGGWRDLGQLKLEFKLGDLQLLHLFEQCECRKSSLLSSSAALTGKVQLPPISWVCSWSVWNWWRAGENQIAL